MRRHMLAVDHDIRETRQTQEGDIFVEKEVEPVLKEEMLEEPLSPKSIMYLQGDSTHILVTIGMSSHVSLETVREKLPLTLLKHPRFSSVLVGDIPGGSQDLRWVQTPNVDIDDHIIVPTINPAYEESRAAGDKFVEDYLHDLSKTAMDISKPLWELHVLDLKTSEAECTGVFRIHHSLGDGASLVSILVACTRQMDNPDALPTIPTLKTTKEAKKSFVTLVVWWLQALWNTMNGVLVVLATTFFLKDSDLLMPREETRVKPRSFVHRTVSLDDMKMVKDSMNVTINDVALGMIEAGFSKSLNRKFNGEEKTKSNNILKNIRTRMAVVFNLRPFTANIQGLADMMDKDNKVRWGNRLGYVLIPMPICIRNDPLDYVRKVKAEIDRKKISLEPLYSIKMGEIAMKLFGTKVAAFLSLKAVDQVAMLVSNMPGPMEQIGFFGHPISFIAPAGYGQPNPVKINLMSYMDKMSIVVSVRDGVDIDSHQLCDDIAESLTLLKDAIKKY